MHPNVTRLFLVLMLVWDLSRMTERVLAADAGGICPLGCFQGKCTSPNSCQCLPGWTNLLNTTVLPCVVPNCNMNVSCSSSSRGLLPPPSPPPPQADSFVCTGVICGPGKCVAGDLPISSMGFRCDCNPGYGNLFNFSAAPCVVECAIFAECTDLGLAIGASPPGRASPPGALNFTGSPNSVYRGADRLSTALILTVVSLGLMLYVDLPGFH